MALSTDRNTPKKDSRLLSAPVAAGAKIYAGALVAASATGYAAPGSAVDTLTAIGRANEQVDNTDGADGDLHVEVEHDKEFWFFNSATDAVTQAEFGKDCYIEDDETVCKTAAGKSVAGRVTGLENGGVWVYIP